MNTVVVPTDVDVDGHGGAPQAPEATSTPTDESSPSTVKGEDVAVAGESLDVEMQHQLDRLLTTCVPNQALWPRIRDLSVSTDMLLSDKMPFPERTFFVSSNDRNGAWRSFLGSIVLPYYGAMFSVGGSAFVAFAAVVDQMRLDDQTDHPAALGVAMAGPLLLGISVMYLLHEYPCRLFLYHRLWEQKIVIDFKARPWSHKVTLAKLLLLVVCVGFYVGYGWLEFRARLSFYLAVAQSFGTIGWVIYSNLTLDKYLLPLNEVLHHTRSRVCKEPVETSSNKTTVDPQSPSLETQEHHPPPQAADSSMIPSITTSSIDTTIPTTTNKPLDEPEVIHSLASTVAQLRVVPESAVKYDCIALRRYLLDIRARWADAKDQKPKFDRECQWLAVAGTYVGRLGNTRATVTAATSTGTAISVGFRENELYASNFLGDSCLYNDEVWHGIGSFQREPNQSGFSAWWLQWSITLSIAAFVGIELAVMYGRPHTAL